MSHKKSITITISEETERRIRNTVLAREFQQMSRDGVKLRAATFVDRRKEASRKACRGKNSANW
jgi:hypothetical protein